MPPTQIQSELAARAVLNRDATLRWHGDTPEARAFFAVPTVAPKAPARGLVAASEIASHDKQRRYSMYTAMAQRVFSDETQQAALDVMPEIDGF